MGERTGIEWTDATWSPWWGCTAISTGEKGACSNCYAEVLGNRFGVKFGAGEPRRLASAAYWDKPRIWNAKAQRNGTRPFVFPSMCDPFDREVPALWRAWFFERIRTTPNLVWLLLTKRPSMIEKLAAEAGGLPPNAAIGATMVTQPEYDRDIEHLRAAKRTLKPLFIFGSFEPLMEEIDLRLFDVGDIDWVIAGGESGPHARPSHPDWFRKLRDQCRYARVPFLFKQWGEWAPHDAWRCPPMRQEPGWPTIYRTGKKNAGRLLDGAEHNGFPPGFGKGEP